MMKAKDRVGEKKVPENVQEAYEECAALCEEIANSSYIIDKYTAKKCAELIRSQFWTFHWHPHDTINLNSKEYYNPERKRVGR